jgi:pimeloyl-ACP methyl ester carboxylesterase
MAVKQLKDARLRIVEDSGHSPLFDKPQEFYPVVLEFLDG